MQYADFAIWQRDWLAGPELARQNSYWTTQLADAPLAVELPLDYPRPAVQSYRGAWASALVNMDLLDGLRALAAREGATLFMVLLAVLCLGLSGLMIPGKGGQVGPRDVLSRAAAALNERSGYKKHLGKQIGNVADSREPREAKEGRQE